VINARFFTGTPSSSAQALRKPGRLFKSKQNLGETARLDMRRRPAQIMVFGIAEMIDSEGRLFRGSNFLVR
jgi:hypothetical protein